MQSAEKHSLWMAYVGRYLPVTSWRDLISPITQHHIFGSRCHFISHDIAIPGKIQKASINQEMSFSQVDFFEADPYLAGIDPDYLQEGFYEEQSTSRATFGLPLVAAWRSFPPSMESAYRSMAERAAMCFPTTSGYAKGNGCKDEPDAHIYPFEDLHVTIATFRSLLDPIPPNMNDEKSEYTKNMCINIVNNATTREDWPEGSENSKVKLCLQPKEIRLFKKNAIILWEETTGNLEAMRICLKKEMEAQQSMKCGINEMNLLSDTFSVPNIVHSTFIRFWKCTSNPDMLMQMIKESTFLDFMPAEVEVNANATLVCESTPCMHINDDAYHVLWRDD